MFKKISVAILVAYVMMGCSPSSTEKTGELKQDTVVPQIVVEKERNDSLESAQQTVIKTNDTLNALANIMSGISDTSFIYQYVQNTADFKSLSKNFDKRWNT